MNCIMLLLKRINMENSDIKFINTQVEHAGQ